MCWPPRFDAPPAPVLTLTFASSTFEKTLWAALQSELCQQHARQWLHVSNLCHSIQHEFRTAFSKDEASKAKEKLQLSEKLKEEINEVWTNIQFLTEVFRWGRADGTDNGISLAEMKAGVKVRPQAPGEGPSTPRGSKASAARSAAAGGNIRRLSTSVDGSGLITVFVESPSDPDTHIPHR